MSQLPFADYFLTGSVLSLVLPLALLISIAVWYVFAARRVPADTPESAMVPPSREVLDAAGPAAIAEVTLEADVTPVDHEGEQP